MKEDNKDIYKHHFDYLFEIAQSLVGHAEHVGDDVEDEEFTIEKSNLLFDVGGADFNVFKACEAEYRYWVEVYILKIVENILSRKGVWYEEHYHQGNNEQHSIKISYDGKLVEAYFLFDIVSEEPNRTEYDQLGKIFREKHSDVDEVNIFIFRDCITYFDLANLVNENKEMSENGFVSIFPLQYFFDKIFGQDEYPIFLNYAESFFERCNGIISYKTIVAPTPKTIAAFKHKKSKMLREYDYKKIADKGMSGKLIDSEFEKVRKNYIDGCRYYAMLSNNDFADSFISAEWAYDVYSNAMGELELTGIIAGYLKSIEQLLYAITKFHIDEGFKIKTKNGYAAYTKDNEGIIDSTLNSLNTFVTSKEAKLPISSQVRGCMNNAMDTWRKFQRNGYFHKHNLYKSDNKIDEVRELTIYLYFLILGGIQLSEDQRKQLEAFKPIENFEHFTEEYVYSNFKGWFECIKKYDMSLVKSTAGVQILISYNTDHWELDSYLLKEFHADNYAKNQNDNFPDNIITNHIRDIAKFEWKAVKEDDVIILGRVEHLVKKIEAESPNFLEKIDGIVLSAGKITKVIYFKK